MAASTESNAAGLQEENQALPPDVQVTDDMLRRMVRHGGEVHPRVYVGGLSRTSPTILRSEIRRIEGRRKLGDVLEDCRAAQDRWMKMGMFKNVRWSLEPLRENVGAFQEEGKAGDSGDATEFVARFEVEERRQTKELAVFTSAAAVPEVRVRLMNMFGRGYSLVANYLPPPSRNHAWSVSAVSNTPFFGNSCEYSIGQGVTTNQLHAADQLKTVEGKIRTDFGGGYNSNWHHDLTLGYQQNSLGTRSKSSAVHPDVAEHLGTYNKAYVQYQGRYSALAYHAHPVLRSLYPLPVSGGDMMFSTALSTSVNDKYNDVVRESFLWRSELWASRHFLLSPFLSLTCNVRAGATFHPDPQHQLTPKQVPLPERFFLTWRNVRGYKCIGPSTEGDNLSIFDTTSNQTRAVAGVNKRFTDYLGGNAVWAASITANCPLPQSLLGGFLATHWFADIGNSAFYRNPMDLWKNIRQFFSEGKASIGGGLVLAQVPMIGPVPSGRLEFNVAFPLVVNKSEDSGMLVPRIVTDPNRKVFDSVRFGLVWSDADP